MIINTLCFVLIDQWTDSIEYQKYHWLLSHTKFEDPMAPLSGHSWDTYSHELHSH